MNLNFTHSDLYSAVIKKQVWYLTSLPEIDIKVWPKQENAGKHAHHIKNRLAYRNHIILLT